jgi:hypothetical protein
MKEWSVTSMIVAIAGIIAVLKAVSTVFLH